MVGERLEEGLAAPHLAGMVVMVSDKGEGEVRALLMAAPSQPTSQRRISSASSSACGRRPESLAGGAREVFTPVHGWVGTRLGVPVRRSGACRNHRLHAVREPPDEHMQDGTGSFIQRDRQREKPPSPGFIADSSVFPTSLGVNPQLTTLVVATAIGRRMLEA